jgi:cysteine-rich repeat protein
MRDCEGIGGGAPMIGCFAQQIRCGDAVTNGNEQCDDGNNASGDGCSASCTAE